MEKGQFQQNLSGNFFYYQKQKYSVENVINFNRLWIKFRKGESSDSFETVCSYVFWHTDYEYNRENFRLADFYGKNHENPVKIMVSGVYLRKY